MKHFLLPIALLLATSLNAQTTAADFTANDCNGNPHNLFTELDAGNVVILEMVMMGCQPCVTGAQSLTTNVLPNVSDPTRVKLYSIGFTNSINCTQMLDWKNTNGFTHTVFAGMSNLTTYYGGMGMPTIAVVGGTDHAVHYVELGHSNSDNPVILAAIEAALAGGNGISELEVNEVSISPNPTSDMLTVSDPRWTNAQVLDLQGRVVLSGAVHQGRVDVSILAVGNYLLRLTDANGERGTARFEKM